MNLFIPIMFLSDFSAQLFSSIKVTHVFTYIIKHTHIVIYQHLLSFLYQNSSSKKMKIYKKIHILFSLQTTFSSKNNLITKLIFYQTYDFHPLY